MAIPSLTRAGDQDPLERERASVARMSAANLVAERHGRYIQARAVATESSGSAQARTEAWLGRMQGWIEGWLKVLALADLKDDVPYSVFEDNLTKLLQGQSDELTALGIEAQSITQLANTALNYIATPADIPNVPDMASYQDTLNLLVRREGELRAMLNDVGHTAENRLEKLGQTDGTSRKAVYGRLKAALLAKGRYPLDQTLAQVDALLSAEKTVDPILARLNGGFTRMNGYNANLAYFHGMEEIVPARKDCTDARTAISKLSSPAGFVSKSKTRVEQLCTGIEKLYADLTGDASITKAQYVGEYLRTEKTRLPTVCPRDVSSPACDKLAVLAALSATDLGQMDDARLRFVELGWSEAMNRALGK
ncbi:hypothetical protein LVJ94_25790 [Pendulispora rubella]|uniref:Secreted protein n=1 Tax=Pendulispora rubella TaxID=2741070 RepID=A0ABZ2LI67_9BACT